MTKSRLIGGIIFMGLGVLIMGLASLGSLDMMIGSFFYSVPLVIIGIIILLNKGEDKIEQINYSKIKRRK